MPPMRKRKAPEKEVQAEKPAAGDPDEGSNYTEDGADDNTSASSDSSFPTEGSDEPPPDAEDPEDGDEEDVSEITVEFQFFEPQEIDFLGLKNLLSRYLNGKEFDSSGLVDAIITDGNVATIVKTANDDDPIAMMVVLNTHEYKDAAFMQDIRSFLVENAPKQVDVAQAFTSEGTGLILNERLLNTPPSLAPPLVQFLLDELEERAAEGDEDAHYFKFKRFLLATRVYVDNSSQSQQQQEQAQHGTSKAGSSQSSGAGPSRTAKRSKHAEEPEGGQQQQQSLGKGVQGPGLTARVDASSLVFTRPEDEFLHEQCTWSFVLPIEDRPVMKDGLQPSRLVMQVEAHKMVAAQEQLNKVIDNLAKAHSRQQAGMGGQSHSRRDTVEEVQRLAEEARAASAAAGAGRGGRKGGKPKRGAQFSARATQL